MNKLTLATLISTAFAAPTIASPITYTNQLNSGTGSDPLAGFSVGSQAVASPRYAWYVDPASGSASNINEQAISVNAAASWTFDFSDPTHVSFSGNLYLGDFRVQQNNFLSGSPGTAFNDGRASYTGVRIDVAGVGTYDEAINVFSFSFLNPTTNGNGGSTYSESSPATCINGKTHSIDRACARFTVSSKEWEGLALNLVFSEDKSSFTGSMQGIDINGTGLTRSTTTINWTISEVPVPPAVWLFGSGLLGLAASGRRRKR